MKRIVKNQLFFTAVLIIFTALICGIKLRKVWAAGLLKPVNGSASEVSMKSQQVQVILNNGFARTEVDQVFINRSDRDMEAVYSFPIPKQGSLSEVSLWIDGQEIIGEVLEKEKAKKTYQEQKAKGNDTALAEKNEYTTFEIKVYPVRALAETRVRLVYYQPMEIDLNVGRYVYQLAEGGVDEERIAFWSVDDKVEESFTFHVQLKSAFPIKDIRLPNFQDQAVITKVDTSDDHQGGGEIYEIALDFSEGGSLARDIVVYYRLDDTVPARVELIPYREDAGHTGTFMVVVTPGASLQRLAEGTDWCFVLDTSGSMSGEKIATLAEGVCKVLTKLNPSDRYRLITFNHRAHDITGGYLPATVENVQRTLEQVRSIRAEGSTALYAGLQMAYRELEEDRTTGLILVTDGVANVGPTRQADFQNLIRQYDLRLFTFVMGNSANQPLLETLARDSGGFAMNISSNDDIIGRIIQAKAKVAHECIHDVELSFSGEKVKDLTCSRIGNLYLGQQLVALGRYTGSGQVGIELKGKIAGNEVTWSCQAHLPEEDTDNPELERLWALASIENVMAEIREKGESDKLRHEVAELGTNFSLVTDYTSMLVLREDEMENLGIQRNNANRVHRERLAQATKSQSPVKNYRVDTQYGSDLDQAGTPSTTPGMFGDAQAPNVGTGPVGWLFLGLAAWTLRRKYRG